MNVTQAIIGNKYTVTSGVWFKEGDVVTLVALDNDLGAEFENAAGLVHFKRFENVEPVVKTPAELAGFVIGNLYKVVDGSKTYSNFRTGDVVEFIRDDKSNQPDFKRVNDGSTQYVMLAALVAYVKTPAEVLGLVIGKSYVAGSASVYAGKVVTFIEDDGTDIPKFNFNDGSKSDYVRIRGMVEFVEPTKTPAEAAGLKVGSTARLTSEQFGNAAGTLVKLSTDDGSRMPSFEVLQGKYKGDDLYFYVSTVTPATGTPAELAGLEIGKKYVITSAEGSFVAGQVVTFKEDDGTRVVPFEPIDGNEWAYAYITNVTPYVAPPAPAVTFVDAGDATTIVVAAKLTSAQREAIQAVVNAG